MTQETLFDEALAKPAAERAAFLDAVCADRPDLRAAVEALLAAHVASGDFLTSAQLEAGKTIESEPGESQQAATQAFTPQPDESPHRPAPPDASRQQIEHGAVIAGRYVLQEKIGEGGMGEVWVAKQTEPVKRRVALKLIKAGMDSRAVLTRFEQERQALAMMDHPNIARVLDGGMTDSPLAPPGGEGSGGRGWGRPFFVMELVNGLPLTRFCDEAKLSPRERLELFVPICQAVQHAHQKGIIHRDLKPANILVTLIDGKPVPKVIDFGVAKATGDKLIDESMFTQFGAVVGTLEYMSPEQAGFTGADIDTRADIYSLGVILYELLTGLRPIDVRRMKKAALNEMVRIIQEEEPSRPSTRLSTEESLPSLAALRQIEPRRLMALLRGELDWVVMKCLEKRRERRYETANGLARDIQRYLADEPVEARPPSAGYRLTKFVRRHRGPVLAGCAMVLFLITGIIGTSWQAWRAALAKDLAEQNELLAKDSAEAERLAKLAEVQQRKTAETAEQRARVEAEIAKAVSEFLQLDVLMLTDLRYQANQRDPVKQNPTIRDALDRAAAKIGDRFQGQELTEAGIRQALGRAYAGLGEPQLGLPHMQRAFDLFKTKLGPDDPRTLEAMTHLADRLAENGEGPKALALREEVARRRSAVHGQADAEMIQARQAVAIHYLNIGRIKEAIAIYEELLPPLERELGKQHALRISSLAGLAAGYSRSGRLAEALPLLQEVHDWHAATMPADHPDVYQTLNSVAECYRNMGRYQEALPLHERCLKERRARFGPAHADTVQSLNNLALNYYQLNRKSEALPLMEEAWTMTKKRLGEDNPEMLMFQANLAQMYLELGRADDAIKLHDHAYRATRAKLGLENSNTLQCLVGLASAYSKAGRQAEAIQLLEEGLAPWLAKKETLPAVALYARHNLGAAYVEVGMTSRSIPLLEASVAETTPLLGKEHPLTVRTTAALGVAYREAGRCAESITLFKGLRANSKPPGDREFVAEQATTHERANQLEEALVLRRALLAEMVSDHGPDDLRTAAAQAQLGGTFLQAKRYAEAEPLFRAALALRQKLEPDAWATFGTKSHLGAALAGLKKYADAEPLLLEGYEGLKKRADKMPPQAKELRLRDALEHLIQLYEAWGKPDDAAKWRKELEVAGKERAEKRCR